MNHIERLSASHIKKLALAIVVVGLLAIGVGVLAITTDTANAHDPTPHEHPHVQADDQPISPEPGDGPPMDYGFYNTSSAEGPRTFHAVSPPQRSCVSQTVRVDMAAMVDVEIEGEDSSMSPWEPANDHLTYKDTGFSTMTVETCVVMVGRARITISE